MRFAPIAAIVSGIALIATVAVVPAATASPAAPDPDSALPSEMRIYAVPEGMPETRAASLTRLGARLDAKALAELKVADRNEIKGTIAELPTPRTVEQELALAARAAEFGQTYVSSDSGQVGAFAAKDYASYTECVKAYASYDPGGWHKNHWAWCQVRTYHIFNSEKGVIVGTGSFKATLIGRGYSGSRKIVLDQYINNVKVSGAWRAGTPRLTVSMPCTGSPRAKHCSVTGGGALLLRSRVTRKVTYTMKSSSADARRGSEKVSTAVFKPKYTITRIGPVGTARGFEQGFRCDSAPYLGKAGACIFDRVRGTFQLKRSDAAVSQAAAHILAAQKGDKNLYPASGRKLPKVLSRMTSKKGIDANRAKAKAACKKKWKTKPKGKDCDEYPFASTNQGAAKVYNKFSVRYIDSDQNRKAGSRLGAWYKTDRILNGDKFEVKIK